MKRLHLSRESLLLAALLLVLVIFSAFVAIRREQTNQASQPRTPYSSHSATPRGLLGLYLWLESIGYHPEQIESDTFELPNDARLLFVTSPSEEIDAREAKYILDWVKRGNVLVTSDDSLVLSNRLFQELDIATDNLSPRVDALVPTQPLVNAALDAVTVDTYTALVPARNDYVSYLDAEGAPVLLRVPYGEGTVWVSSAPNLFTNSSLQNDNNAKLISAILSSIPSGSVVAFDEYHLGFQAKAEGSLLGAVYSAPWGWGLLLALLILVAYLILNGKRFGRTVPVQRTLARRTPSEYVVSMANLFRRANKRGMVLEHYRHSLKRRLGRPFHLNPDIADERYVELMSKLRPDLDERELANILANLRRTDAAEGDLVRTVEHAVTFGAPRAR